jgi:hypothetical protein
MKWVGYLLSVLSVILLIISLPIIRGPVLYLIPLYAGLFVYWTFRPTWNERILAIKKISIVGVILTVILVIESVILQNLVNQVQSLGQGAIPSFWAPSILFVIGLGVVFIAIPALLAFLDGLTKPDSSGLTRNPLLVFTYVILTFGLYQIYWFWLIKKGLCKNDIETASLWWFLLPIIGQILLYFDFSRALEQHTKRKFVMWFLIFLVFSGLDVVINQAILNYDQLKL